jgi:hypothetical protein
VSRIQEKLRERLSGNEERLAFSASVVAVDTDDVLAHDANRDPWWANVVRDATPVVGPRPEELASRLRRTRAVRERRAS